MRWLLTAQEVWQRLLKDVCLTGLGMFAIYSQIGSAHPNGYVVGAGLALTVPSVADHLRALLPSAGGGSSEPPATGGGGGRSSAPSLPPGQPQAGSGNGEGTGVAAKAQ